MAVEAADSASQDSETSETKGCDLGYLNEQWVQSYIGFKLNHALCEAYGSEGPWVTFETNVDSIQNCFDRKRGRPAGSLTERQRFDLLLWSQAGLPVALVEIKDQPSMGRANCLQDPIKIEAALRRWDSIEFGMFVFSVRSNAEDFNRAESALKRKRKEISEEISGKLRRCSVAPAKFFVPRPHLAWSGVSIRLNTE